MFSKTKLSNKNFVKNQKCQVNPILKILKKFLRNFNEWKWKFPGDFLRKKSEN